MDDQAVGHGVRRRRDGPGHLVRGARARFHAHAGATVVGYALMVGGVQTVAGVGPLLVPESGIALIYLLGRLVSAVFALLTGVAVLFAHRWRGWTAFAPLLVGLCPLVGGLGA